MKTVFIWLLGFALLLLSPGARSADYSQWDKRWDEYVSSPTAINALDLYKLCWVSFTRRQYQKLNFCLDDLDRRIRFAKEGDLTFYYKDSFMSEEKYREMVRCCGISMKEVHPAIIHWMRAEVLIELGEPGRAVTEAKASLASLPQVVREQNFFGSYP